MKISPNKIENTLKNIFRNGYLKKIKTNFTFLYGEGVWWQSLDARNIGDKTFFPGIPTYPPTYKGRFFVFFLLYLKLSNYHMYIQPQCHWLTKLASILGFVKGEVFCFKYGNFFDMERELLQPANKLLQPTKKVKIQTKFLSFYKTLTL